MDAAAHYRHLLSLGRDEFLAASAPAALVRHHARRRPRSEGFDTVTIDAEAVDETLPLVRQPPVDAIDVEVYPLAKKPGASFPDRITIGRTSNNDVVIADHSVSRFHAYVKRAGSGWFVADAGSKNGSQLRGDALEARREQPITSRAVLRIGDVDLTFYLAADLFTALGGT
jgi:hypothetical protein